MNTNERLGIRTKGFKLGLVQLVTSVRFSLLLNHSVFQTMFRAPELAFVLQSNFTRHALMQRLTVHTTFGETVGEHISGVLPNESCENSIVE